MLAGAVFATGFAAGLTTGLATTGLATTAFAAGLAVGLAADLATVAFAAAGLALAAFFAGAAFAATGLAADAFTVLAGAALVAVFAAAFAAGLAAGLAADFTGLAGELLLAAFLLAGFWAIIISLDHSWMPIATGMQQAPGGGTGRCTIAAVAALATAVSIWWFPGGMNAGSGPAMAAAYSIR